MKRILIATDGSAAAQHAVELGVELAKHEEAAIAFVHVVPLFDLVSTNGFDSWAASPTSRQPATNLCSTTR